MNKTLAIIPFSDIRENDNSNMFILYALPLMPFGMENYNTPEGPTMHCNSSLWMFRPNEDLAKAVAEELRNSGMFKESYFSFKEDGELILRGKIVSTGYHCKLLSYGLSILGPNLWWFGFPVTYVENNLTIEIKIEEKATKRVLFDKRYEKDIDVVSWIYSMRSDLTPEKRTPWLRDNPGVFKCQGTFVV